MPDFDTPREAATTPLLARRFRGPAPLYDGNAGLRDVMLRYAMASARLSARRRAMQTDETRTTPLFFRRPQRFT